MLYLPVFLVDDVLFSCDTIEEAIEFLTYLRQLCASGGFNLTRIISHHPEVISAFPAEITGLKSDTYPIKVDLK